MLVYGVLDIIPENVLKLWERQKFGVSPKKSSEKFLFPNANINTTSTVIKALEILKYGLCHKED